MANAPLKRVLHIGCGQNLKHKLHPHFQSEEWKEIRLDIDPAVQPDVVCDIRDMHTIPARSFDAVWSSHNLEHVESHDVIRALRECIRVLKPEGFLLITLPDLQAVGEELAKGNIEGKLYDSPAGPIAAIDIIYGFRKSIMSGKHFMAHRTGFTRDSLGAKLKQAGFKHVFAQRDAAAYALWAVAYREVLPEDAFVLRSQKRTEKDDPSES